MFTGLFEPRAARFALLGDFLALCGSHFFGAALSIGMSVFTTKLLSPSDYGLFAVMLFNFTLFSWLSDLGLDQALLAQALPEFAAACQAHLGLRLLASCLPLLFLLFGQLFFGSNYYLTLLFLILSLGFAAEKIGQTFKVWLEKFGRLKTAAWLELVAGLFGGALALVFALNGFAAISLAVQWTGQRLLLLVGYWWQVKQSILPSFDARRYAQLLRHFALPAFLASSFGLLTYDFIPFLLAKLTTTAQAGLYVRAFSLATMPLMLSAVFGRILTSKVAQNVGQHTGLRRWFGLLQCSKALLVLPLQLGLMLTSPWWCGWLFAARWQGLVPVYLALACYGLVRAFYDDVTVLLTVGLHQPWHFCQAQALHAGLIVLLSAPWICWQQALGAAIAMAFSMSLVVWFFWYKILAQLGVSLNALLAEGFEQLMWQFARFFLIKKACYKK